MCYLGCFKGASSANNPSDAIFGSTIIGSGYWFVGKIVAYNFRPFIVGGGAISLALSPIWLPYTLFRQSEIEKYRARRRNRGHN